MHSNSKKALCQSLLKIPTKPHQKVSPFSPHQTQQYQQFLCHQIVNIFWEFSNVKILPGLKEFSSMMEYGFYNEISLLSHSCCIMFWKFHIVWPKRVWALLYISSDLYIYTYIYVKFLFSLILQVKFLQHFTTVIWNNRMTQKEKSGTKKQTAEDKVVCMSKAQFNTVSSLAS